MRKVSFAGGEESCLEQVLSYLYSTSIISLNIWSGGISDALPYPPNL